MSDEAVAAAASGGGAAAAKIDYTLARYLKYAKDVDKIKKTLNKSMPKGGGGGGGGGESRFTAVDVERALWSRAVLGGGAGGGGAEGGSGSVSREPLAEKNDKRRSEDGLEGKSKKAKKR